MTAAAILVACVLFARCATCNDEELLVSIQADVSTTSYLIPTIQETINMINNSTFLEINFTTSSDTPRKYMAVIEASCINHSVNDTEATNVTTISCCGSRHPVHSNLYVIVPSSNVAVAVINIMKFYNWKRARLISDNSYNELHNELVRNAVEHNIEIDALLLSKDASIPNKFDRRLHILILNVKFESTLNLLCEAYSQQKYYPNYAFLLINDAFMVENWWIVYEAYINCTMLEVMTVLNRALVLSSYPFSKIASIYLQDYVSDAIVLSAIALDDCLTYYNSSLNHCKHNLSKYIEEQNAVGKTGNISFQNGSRESDYVLVRQYQYERNRDTLITVNIGVINTERHHHLDLNFNDAWPDGVPPDGTPVVVIAKYQVYAVVVSTIFLTIALVFVIICLVVSIVFRRRRIIKLISPNLNYVMLSGAFLMIVSALPMRYKSKTLQTIACISVRLFISIGYTMCFGVALTKMWRVFYIFKINVAKSKKVQDWKLMMAVLTMVVVHVIIVLPVTVLAIIYDDVDYENSGPLTYNIQDVEIENRILRCGTTIYFTLYLIVSSLYQMVLHIAGLILAWLTRKVHIAVLNDYKYTVAIIYSSTVSIVICGVMFSIGLEANVVAILWPFLVLVLIAMFLGLTFIPKFIALYKDPEGRNIFNQAKRLKEEDTTQLTIIKT